MVSLITGGAGFIGSHLAERLLAGGDEVLVIDNFSTGRRENVEHLLGNPRFRLVYGDILDSEDLELLIAGSDIVYHLAAAVGVKLVLSQPLESLRINVRGTERVIELASCHRKKVFLASTSEVYGKNGHRRLKETDDRVLGPATVTRWGYSISKAFDECLALAYHQEAALEVVIVRFFNIVGPRQTGRYGMVLPTFVRQALSGEPITVYGDGKQVRTFTYVGDAVEATIKLAQHPKAVGEIFNVGSSDSLTINQLAALVKQEAGSSSEIVHIPYEEAYGANFEDMRERVPSVSKLRAFTGFEAGTPLDRVIREVIEDCRCERPESVRCAA